MRPAAHTFRYLVEDARAGTGATVALAEEDGRHLTRVVRRGPGDALEVFDGEGGLWEAEVVAVGARVLVRVGSPRAAPPELPVRLCIGLLDSARLDLVVEKAVELGVAEVVVASTARVRRPPDVRAWERRNARLRRLVVGASRQCGRPRLMPVLGLVPFAAIVAETAAGTGYVVDPRADEALVAAAAAPPPGAALTVAVGPEAGFDPDEVDAACAAGWRACGLGPHVLRAETAALAAVTIAGAAAGGFGAGG